MGATYVRCCIKYLIKLTYYCWIWLLYFIPLRRVLFVSIFSSLLYYRACLTTLILHIEVLNTWSLVKVETHFLSLFCKIQCFIGLLVWMKLNCKCEQRNLNYACVLLSFSYSLSLYEQLVVLYTGNTREFELVNISYPIRRLCNGHLFSFDIISCQYGGHAKKPIPICTPSVLNKKWQYSI